MADKNTTYCEVFVFDSSTGLSTHCKDKMPKIWNKYSQKRNIGASVPIYTFMCLWANYIFPRWVCLFCWRKYVDWSWEYINQSKILNVEIGAEAALFPEKEYINGIAVAVQYSISYSSISAVDNQRTVAEFIDHWLGDKVNSGIGLSYRPSSHDFIFYPLALSPSQGSMNSATVLCGMTGFRLGGPSWGQILSPWLGLKDFQNWKEQANTLSLIF